MRKKNPEVSILLSVYNSASSLDRCLKSIQDQTYSSWTIICIDDASTDETPQILKRWQKKLTEQLTVIRNKANLGLTKSLNKGLKHIITPFTARIDADDWWHPDKLHHQLDFMKNHANYRLTGTNYMNVSNKGEKPVMLLETDEKIRHSIVRRNPFAHSCIIFDTKMVQRLNGYDGTVRYGQDYDLWLKCLPYTKYYNLPEFLCYRTIGQGISVEKQRQQMLQSVKTQLKYIRHYRLSPVNYFYLLEPLTVAYTPKFIKQLKRGMDRS